MARSDNLKLGNWMKNKYGNLGNQWKTCRVYSTNGPDVMLNEVHVLLEWPAKANGRKTAGLVEYVQQYLEMANKYILKRYLMEVGSWSCWKRAPDIHTVKSMRWGVHIFMCIALFTISCYIFGQCTADYCSTHIIAYFMKVKRHKLLIDHQMLC